MLDADCCWASDYCDSCVWLSWLRCAAFNWDCIRGDFPSRLDWGSPNWWNLSFPSSAIRTVSRHQPLLFVVAGRWLVTCHFFFIVLLSFADANNGTTITPSSRHGFSSSFFFIFFSLERVGQLDFRDLACPQCYSLLFLCPFHTFTVAAFLLLNTPSCSYSVEHCRCIVELLLLRSVNRTASSSSPNALDDDHNTVLLLGSKIKGEINIA